MDPLIHDHFIQIIYSFSIPLIYFAILPNVCLVEVLMFLLISLFSVINKENYGWPNLGPITKKIGLFKMG